MKSFSTAWKGSKQPRKQRKYRYNADLHTKGKFLAGHLSAELRKQQGKRSLRIRKGDKVKVVRGQYKGREGKVERVSLKHERVFITGIDLDKQDGSKTIIPIHPSNCLIKELDITDKRRFKRGEKK